MHRTGLYRKRDTSLILLMGITGALGLSQSQDTPQTANRSQRDAQEPERPGSRPGEVQAANGDPAAGSGSSETRRGKRLETARIGSGTHQFEIMKDELLVRLRSSVPATQAETLARRLHSRILGRGSRSGLFRLELPAGSTLASFQARLSEEPEVQSVRPNAIAVATDCPTGNHRSREWNLDRIQEVAACADYTPGLSSVVVAVLDTGVAYEDYSDGRYSYQRLPDLAGVSFLPGYDFVNDDAHPNDDNQHGSHVTGVIAAQGSVVGVAPGVQILPIKVLGSDKRGSELQVVEGIYYAVDHGADVINMSLSFGLGYFPGPELQDAIGYAIDNGVVLTASSGNEGIWGVSYPAAFPDVIAVGAGRMARNDGDLTDRKASYSNFGGALDLLGPGGLLRADIDRDSYPDAILAQTFSLNHPTDIGYWYFVGTSQATAHVSAVSAWLLADGASPAQVGPLLQASANDLGASEHDYRTGSGYVQIQNARDLVAAGIGVDVPEYYANLLPVLVAGSSSSTVRPRVRIEVLDGQGNPAAGVKVAGSWFGSVTSFESRGHTDSGGVAWLEAPEIPSSAGVAVGFQLDLVAAPGARVPSRPLQFYSLSPAAAELYARLLEAPEAENAMLLFRLDPSDSALDGLVDRTSLKPGYLMKPVGPGMRSGPLAIVFDDGFAPELSQPDPATVTPELWTFPAALYSGWGQISEVAGTLVSASVPDLGAASSYLVVPLDPAMVHLDLAHCYPVINALPSNFLSLNQAFGNGFASSTLGNGFASSTLGNGFASSTLGNGFASSTLGTGFASSTLGNGFASSTLGNGFASSTLGSGFASSTLGNGFASSTLGAGDAQRKAGASSVDDGDNVAPIDQVDPTTLVTDEALLE